MSAAAGSNVHASLVVVDGTGILVRGEARSGKSSLVLSLLRASAREGRRAALVADDRVDLRLEDGHPAGSAPAALRGLIEISGVGILRLDAADACARIDIVVDLAERPERLPEPGLEPLLGIGVRHIVLPARQASLCADILLTLLASGTALVTDQDRSQLSEKLETDGVPLPGAHVALNNS